MILYFLKNATTFAEMYWVYLFPSNPSICWSREAGLCFPGRPNWLHSFTPNIQLRTSTQKGPWLKAVAGLHLLAALTQPHQHRGSVLVLPLKDLIHLLPQTSQNSCSKQRTTNEASHAGLSQEWELLVAFTFIWGPNHSPTLTHVLCLHSLQSIYLTYCLTLATGQKREPPLKFHTQNRSKLKLFVTLNFPWQSTHIITNTSALHFLFHTCPSLYPKLWFKRESCPARAPAQEGPGHKAVAGLHLPLQAPSTWGSERMLPSKDLPHWLPHCSRAQVQKRKPPAQVPRGKAPGVTAAGPYLPLETHSQPHQRCRCVHNFNTEPSALPEPGKVKDSRCIGLHAEGAGTESCL